MPLAGEMSAAMEDYLEAILALQEDDQPVRVTDIARRLGISKASVTQALGGLREAGFIQQQPYGRVYLAPQGRERAFAVAKRHQVLRTFLVDVLAVPGATAEGEACRLEHAISPDTVARLVAFLEKRSEKES